MILLNPPWSHYEREFHQARRRTAILRLSLWLLYTAGCIIIGMAIGSLL